MTEHKNSWTIKEQKKKKKNTNLNFLKWQTLQNLNKVDLHNF